MTDVQLTQLYREQDLQIALFADRLRDARRYETDLFIPTFDAKLKMEQQLKTLSAGIQQLSAPDPVYQIMQEHYRNFLTGQEKVLQTMFARPARYLNSITYTVTNLSRKDSRDAATRSSILIKRLAQAEEVWQGILAWLETASATDIQEMINAQQIMVATLKKETEHLAENFSGLAATDIAVKLHPRLKK